MSKLYWISLYGALFMALVIAGFSYTYNKYGQLLPPDDLMPDVSPAVGLVLLGLTHALILRYWPRLSTQGGRRLALFLWGAGFVLFCIMNDIHDPYDLLGLSPFLLFPLVPFWLYCTRAYSIPSSLSGTLPLLLNYFFLFLFFIGLSDGRCFYELGGDLPIWQRYVIQVPLPFVLGVVYFAIFPLAGRLFPHHRRLREFWHPAKLPCAFPIPKPVHLAPEDEY